MSVLPGTGGPTHDWVRRGAKAVSCSQDLGSAVWIMGLVSGCALGVSFLLAVVYLWVTVFSGAARHYRFISTPAA